jgi:outer membrane protein TolC
MKGKKWLPFLLMAVSLLKMQPATAQSVLNNYIRQGLDSNLALRQKNFDLEKARLDLKRAQSLFFPQASFASQYTLANGGRTQDIPIGDLLNGVYSTLNQLTGSNKFPQVDNQNIQFLPNDFHDTRVELSMPLVNRQIKYNREIKEELINTQQADADAYRRELVKTIKQAYYQFLQAHKAVEIYTNALALVNENVRVSEKLVKNGTATKEMTLRARAQVSQVQTSLTEARNNRQNAIAYFNFLLNQPLNNAVTVDSLAYEQLNASIPPFMDVPRGREELAKLRSLQNVSQTHLKLNRSCWFPMVNAFYHVGFQGYGFKFNNEQFYQLGGLQLQWPLFRGNENKYKIRQAEIESDALAAKYKEVEQQLTLQVQTAYNNYRSAVQTLESVQDEVQSSAETYRLTERRFREGQALQIELTDARTQLTSAQLKYSLAQLAALTRSAELEYATASYKF